MRYLLVKMEDDWADEFDICSCRAIAVDDEDYKIFFDELEKLKTRTGEIMFYFGTNEQAYYENGEQFYNVIKVQEITKEEYDTLYKLGLNDFGNFDIVYEILDRYFKFENMIVPQIVPQAF